MLTSRSFIIIALSASLLPVSGGQRPPAAAGEAPSISFQGVRTAVPAAVDGLGTLRRGSRRAAAKVLPRPPRASLVFEGLANDEIISPPDPVGDVGLDHYVQGVNQARGTALGVFRKDGTPEMEPVRLSSLWKDSGGPCASNGQGDGIVQYDTLADRWVFAQFAFRYRRGIPQGPFYECVAVTQSPDPLGPAAIYTFLIHRTFLPDAPKIGVWPDGYYMTAPLFGPSGYAGQAAIALDRESMLQGLPARQMVMRVASGGFGMQPSDVVGRTPPPPGSPNYLVAVRDDNLGADRDKLVVYGFTTDWAAPSQSELRKLATLPVRSFNSEICQGNVFCLLQKGTNMTLDVVSSDPFARGTFTSYPLSYRRLGDDDSLLLSHPMRAGKRRAGVRWYEVRDLDGTPYLRQQGTHTGRNVSRWVSSISMDGSGNIAMGYSTVGPRRFPSIRYAARLASDTEGEMSQGETTLVQGGAPQKATPRWGDYTSLSVDPIDDCTFWYTNEFYPAGAERWHTAVAAFTLPGCEANP